MLEEAGLISRERHAQWRPSSLRGETLHAARSWMDGLAGHWDRRLDRLAEHLENHQQSPNLPAPAGSREEQDA